jgi:large subunit ribosomal protein L29
MDYKEITTKPIEELKRELSRIREEYHAFGVKVRMNEAKDTHKLAQFKKDIARILTALRSK